VEVGVGLLHGGALLGAHREGLVVRAGEGLAGAQLGEHGLHVLDRAAYPLQSGVGETLADEYRTHLVVSEDAAIVAFGGLVQFDAEVPDTGGLELFGDAPLHVACGLANFEEALCASSAIE